MTTRCHWHQWDVQYRCMRKQTRETHGRIILWTYCTWQHHLSTTYRTHLCHVKETRSERLSDTVHFSHKNITRPTVTHTDKIMKAIAECAKTIKDMKSEQGQGKKERKQLPKDTTTAEGRQTRLVTARMQQVLRVQAIVVPRVESQSGTDSSAATRAVTLLLERAGCAVSKGA